MKETAINIGYSSMLLTEDMIDVFIISGDNEEKVKEEITRSQKKIADCRGHVEPTVSTIGTKYLTDEENFVMV